MVPTGDYETESEDEDSENQTEDVTVITDNDNLCKVFDEASNETDDERLSQLIQENPLSRDYSSDTSLMNNPRTSEAQRITDSTTLKYVQEKKSLLFDSFHPPYPLLSTESRRFDIIS